MVITGSWLSITYYFAVGRAYLEMVMDAFQQVKEARPASTQVRTALENLAVQR